eukprot:TRINITY_DN7388_c0_g1_i4.p1 TRINITY_DN7388_c0_g1~~TRINITY_DN7388_c0_g1_i4.p1  ORF type:complete len:312 (-),score=44.36 TRINITY_DN7388_c0_g1_i4:1264-2100(-)
MRNLITLTLLLLTISAQGLLKVGMTKFLEGSYPYFMNFTTDGQCSDSYECDIVNEICMYLDEDCEVVLLPDLDARFSSLENGEVDFTISVISVNLQRAERVHFVRPYYYYAGAVVFHLDNTALEDQYAWSDVRGVSLCANENYYAAPAISFAYQPLIVEIAGNNATNVENGICDAAIADSSGIIKGMVQSINTPPRFGAPYGIAVSKADAASLGARISEVLIDMMDDGPASEILEIENENLIKGGGFLPSVKLQALVDTITEAGGPISPLVEDAIWEA